MPKRVFPAVLILLFLLISPAFAYYYRTYTPPPAVSVKDFKALKDKVQKLEKKITELDKSLKWIKAETAKALEESKKIQAGAEKAIETSRSESSRAINYLYLFTTLILFLMTLLIVLAAFFAIKNLRDAGSKVEEEAQRVSENLIDRLKADFDQQINKIKVDFAPEFKKIGDLNQKVDSLKQERENSAPAVEKPLKEKPGKNQTESKISAKIEPGSNLERLILALKKDNPEARAEAALALGEIKEKKAIPHLIVALTDEDEVVRDNAAWALGEIGDSVAISSLKALLADQDERVRRAAEEALKKIRD